MLLTRECINAGSIFIKTDELFFFPEMKRAAVF